MNNEEAQQVLVNRALDEADGLIALANGWPALIGLATLAMNSLSHATESLTSFMDTLRKNSTTLLPARRRKRSGGSHWLPSLLPMSQCPYSGPSLRMLSRRQSHSGSLALGLTVGGSSIHYSERSGG